MNSNHKLKINGKMLNKKYKIKYNFYKKLVGGFVSIDIKYIKALNDFIIEYNKTVEEKNQIDQSHGLEHALVVLCHVENAIIAYNDTNISKLHADEILKVKLAAFLHDIDDSKYFPENKHYENARFILLNFVPEQTVNDIIQMINWVSSSKNGDTIPEECRNKHWLLYPRYADRLEAIGIIGLRRTLDYNTHKKRPLYMPRDSLAKPNYTIDNIYNEKATLERYQRYSGASESLIGHFYDKLLLLGKYPIRNKYFDDECSKRQKPLEDIALYFEQTGTITEEYIRQYIEKNKEIETSCTCCKSVLQHKITFGGKQGKTRKNKEKQGKTRKNKEKQGKILKNGSKLLH